MTPRIHRSPRATAQEYVRSLARVSAELRERSRACNCAIWNWAMTPRKHRSPLATAQDYVRSHASVSTELHERSRMRNCTCWNWAMTPCTRGPRAKLRETSRARKTEQWRHAPEGPAQKLRETSRVRNYASWNWAMTAETEQWRNALEGPANPFFSLTGAFFKHSTHFLAVTFEQNEISKNQKWFSHILKGPDIFCFRKKNFCGVTKKHQRVTPFATFLGTQKFFFFYETKVVDYQKLM
jgi:hypothetical protein